MCGLYISLLKILHSKKIKNYYCTNYDGQTMVQMNVDLDKCRRLNNRVSETEAGLNLVGVVCFLHYRN
jgi:hypothetical protein